MEAVLIDVMGDDVRVANAARVSFNKRSEWEFPGEKWGPDHFKKQLSEADEKLIKYLAKHNHWTPFSHVQITLREKVPIFVARQRFKHMVGFTYNEVSRRYVDDQPEFYIPEIWRGRAENKKQGSTDDPVKNNDLMCQLYDGVMKTLESYYQIMLDEGVAPEQARMVLPQSLFTEYYVTGSLAAWARAYRLRIDSHAQKEIQTLAKRWGEVIGGIKELEHSWSALIEV